MNLSLGRPALSVLCRLMGSGEAIEVRAPNAVAAVRGSFVVVDVALVGNQPQTRIYALQITTPVTVTSLVTGATTNLAPYTGITLQGLGAGHRIGPVVPIPPQQARALAQTTNTGRQVTASPAAAQIGLRGTQQAATLAQWLTDKSGPPPDDADLMVNLTPPPAPSPPLSSLPPDVCVQCPIINSLLSQPIVRVSPKASPNPNPCAPLASIGCGASR